MTYSDKLRDPRWQKKRLEILQQRNWTCEDCGDTKSTLHVHHCYYARAFEPWEYSDNALKCLCWSCHEQREDLEADIRMELSKFSKSSLVDILTCVLQVAKKIGTPELCNTLCELEASQVERAETKP